MRCREAPLSGEASADRLADCFARLADRAPASLARPSLARSSRSARPSRAPVARALPPAYSKLSTRRFPLVDAELNPYFLHFSLRPLQIWVARRRRADDGPGGLHGRRHRRGAAEGGAVLRCHCASRRNALPVDLAQDRALPVDRASESESLVLDARSGIGGRGATHDAAAARRSAAATTGGSAWPAWGSMEQAR